MQGIMQKQQYGGIKTENAALKALERMGEDGR